VGSRAIKEFSSKAGLPITIVEGQGERLPFGDATFDIVYGRAVLHHAQDLSDLCREAQRVLKPGGVFLMTREHVISRKEDLQTFLDSHPLHRLYGGEHAYMLDDYIRSVRASGLRELKVIGPFESAINFAPMTAEEIHQMIVRACAAIVGTRLAISLAGMGPIQKRYCRRLSRRSNEPGRLYTFRAVK
jgi:SAM-dependent methyltransferase